MIHLVSKRKSQLTAGASVVEAACSLVSASGATDDLSPVEEVEETSTVVIIMCDYYHTSKNDSGKAIN
jgi:hypothetical protein